MSASFPERAPNLSETCPGRPVKELNVLLPQLLSLIISPCGYNYKIQHDFVKKKRGKKKKKLSSLFYGKRNAFSEKHLLSNLEASNVGCFIDGAGILGDAFRKFNSFLYM